MNKIRKLKNFFKSFGIDGYLVPKNDDYFNEYVRQSNDRLKFISNFSGSAGFAIILKNKNYLFVDGRYTIQARIQSGNNFKIILPFIGMLIGILTGLLGIGGGFIIAPALILFTKIAPDLSLSNVLVSVTVNKAIFTSII